MSLYECTESTPACRKSTIKRNGTPLFELPLKKRKIKKKRRSRERFGETNLKKCDFIEEPDIAFSCAYSIPQFGIRGRSIVSSEGLFFKVKVCWLSGAYICFVRHKCFTAQTLVFYGSNTCVLRVKHLCLSQQRIASVKTG